MTCCQNALFPEEDNQATTQWPKSDVNQTGILPI